MKRILLPALFVILAIPVFSQIIHLNGGISYTPLYWVDYTNSKDVRHHFTDPKIGPSASADIELNSDGRFSFIPGIAYYSTGGKRSAAELAKNRSMYRSSYGVKGDSLPVNFQYMSVYFLCSYNIHVIKNRVKLQIQAGPRIDYLFHHNLEDIRFYEEYELNDNTKPEPLNIGATGAAGIYYMKNRIELGITTSYLWRLVPVIDADLGYSITNTTYVKVKDNNWLFNLSVGYKLTQE